MKNNIKEILKEKGITQKRLSELTGITEARLSKAINGSATMPTLKKIAAAIGVDAQELITSAPILKANYGSEKTPLHLGNLSIPCYVLEDGTRVFSRRGMQKVLGSDSKSGQWLSNFVIKGPIAEYFNAGENSILERINKPIKFLRNDAGGSQPITYGHEVTILVDICSAIIDANRAGVFNDEKIVRNADIILRAVAKTGIIALVDEVTGYEEERRKAKDALQKYFEAFLREEAGKWMKTFNDQFFEDIYRMRHWDWGKTAKRPSVVGTWINDIVYERIAPAILESLREKNPKDAKGNRKYKHHQFLTDDLGKPKLQQHLEALHAIAVIADYDWGKFMVYVDRAYPKQHQQLSMIFDEDL